jgi:hypothetical protein
VFFSVAAWNENQSFFNGMMRMDNLHCIYFSGLNRGVVFLLFYYDFFYSSETYFPEIFSIVAFSLAGAVVLHRLQTADVVSWY